MLEERHDVQLGHHVVSVLSRLIFAGRVTGNIMISFCLVYICSKSPCRYNGIICGFCIAQLSGNLLTVLINGSVQLVGSRQECQHRDSRLHSVISWHWANCPILYHRGDENGKPGHFFSFWASKLTITLPRLPDAITICTHTYLYGSLDERVVQTT